MPTMQVYLNDADMSKLVYVQEQKNAGKPKAQQKTKNQIASAWIHNRLEMEEIAPTIEKTLSEEG